jgi:hypothetical protein
MLILTECTVVSLYVISDNNMNLPTQMFLDINLNICLFVMFLIFRMSSYSCSLLLLPNVKYILKFPNYYFTL